MYVRPAEPVDSLFRITHQKQRSGTNGEFMPRRCRIAFTCKPPKDFGVNSWDRLRTTKCRVAHESLGVDHLAIRRRDARLKSFDISARAGHMSRISTATSKNDSTELERTWLGGTV